MEEIDDERWAEWTSWLSTHDGRMPSLAGIDLDGKELEGVDLRMADLRMADLRGADLRMADLRGANLCGANLRGADLREADLDFASWPLCCGSGGVITDKWMAAQLAAHLCALQCDDGEWQVFRKQLLPFARKSHRARELGLLAAPTGDSGERGISGSK